MDTIDFNQTLPSGITFMLQAGGFLAVSVFLVMFIVVKKRWKGRVTPFFLGLTDCICPNICYAYRIGISFNSKH